MNPAWTTQLSTNVTPHTTTYLEEENVVVAILPEVASDGPGLEVLDAQTGKSLGTVQTNGTISHTSAESDGVFVVSTDEYRLYAIEPRTTTVRWQTRATNIKLVTEERVYSYSDATLGAYDLSTGTQQWEHVLPDSQHGPIHSINGALYMQVGEYKDKGLVALNPATGDENWYYRPGSVRRILIDEDGLYVTQFASDDRESEVARIDEQTGIEQWSFSCMSRALSPKMNDQSLFVSEYINGTAAAIDQVSGTLNWRSEENYRCEDIWLEDSVLYIDGEGRSVDEFANKFRAIDLDTGRTKWETELDDTVRVYERDSVSGDIYLGTNDFNDDAGTVYRVTERTGSVQWQSTLGEEVKRIYPEADPILVETRGDEGQKIYALDEDSGKPVWSVAAEDFALPLLVTDERVAASLDDEIHILRRADRNAEARFSSDTYTYGGGTLFVFRNGDTSAYPVAANPEALNDESSQENQDVTEVFTPESAASDHPTSAEDTEIFESDPTDGTQTSPGGQPSVVFCPSCGTDLSEFGDIQYCPSCGSKFPE